MIMYYQKLTIKLVCIGLLVAGVVMLVRKFQVFLPEHLIQQTSEDVWFQMPEHRFNHTRRDIVIDGLHYSFPHDLIPVKPELPTYYISDTTTLENAEASYIKLLSNIQIECRRHGRMGKQIDGGWDWCMVGPYLPQPDCLVYSFGISKDWTFDDAVSEEFNCQVRSFDPTIGLEEHNRSSLIHFYPVGLEGENGDKPLSSRSSGDQVFPVKTLSTIINDLGDGDRIIDYLKMDIESSEWRAITDMLSTSVFSRVKQLGIEFHTYQIASIPAIRAHFDIIKSLQNAGFRLWQMDLNRRLGYISNKKNILFSTGQQVNFININFIRKWKWQVD